jgi:hypothetical protein
MLITLFWPYASETKLFDNAPDFFTFSMEHSFDECPDGGASVENDMLG